MSKEKLNTLLETDYEVKIGQYFKDGFELYKKNIGAFTGITVVILLIYAASFALSLIPILGFIVSLGISVVMYLIMAGYILTIKKIKNNEPYDFKDFFSGFKADTGSIIALNLISGIITMIGFVLCILPGIYLSIGYIFSMYIMLFFKVDFWESMEYSRKIVSKKWFSFLGLLLLIGLLNLLGLLVLGIGLFVTMPMSLCIIYVTFDDIFKPEQDGFEAKIDTFGVQQRDINTEADERRQ